MKKIIIANWKMHPSTLKEARRLFQGIKIAAAKISKFQIVVCPPAVFLYELKRATGNSSVFLGAQDLALDNNEEQTGSLGAEMLRETGARFVIVGHSERRVLGETDEQIALKTKSALGAGFKVFLCFGEEERSEAGGYFEFIERQLRLRLKYVRREDLSKLFLAYEPVWAVGRNSKREATGDEIQGVAIFARKILLSVFGRRSFPAGFIYGGSVSGNGINHFASAAIDGLLVGRVSRDQKLFKMLLDNLSFSHAASSRN